MSWEQMRNSLSWPHDGSLWHVWTEYPGGAAHCPKCGAVRRPNGLIIRKHATVPGCPPLPKKSVRIIDGVTIEGPEA
jgi:hypothetical protein